MPTYVLGNPARKLLDGSEFKFLTVKANTNEQAARRFFRELNKHIRAGGIEGHDVIKLRFSFVKVKGGVRDPRKYDLKEWIHFEGVRISDGESVELSVDQYDVPEVRNNSFQVQVKTISRKQLGGSTDNLNQVGGSGNHIPFYPFEYFAPWLWWDSDTKKDIKYVFDYWPMLYDYWPTTMPFYGLSAYPYMYPYMYNLSEPIIDNS